MNGLDWAALWWQRLPAGVARFSPGLGSALTDGIHLTRWALVARFAPPAVFLLAAVMARLQGDSLITSSLLVVIASPWCRWRRSSSGPGSWQAM